MYFIDIINIWCITTDCTYVHFRIMLFCIFVFLLNVCCFVNDCSFV